MFQMLKPTLILLLCIGAVLGAGQFVAEISKGDPYTLLELVLIAVVIIAYACYELRPSSRQKAQQAAEESNIVTIDNEDCPEL